MSYKNIMVDDAIATDVMEVYSEPDVASDVLVAQLMLTELSDMIGTEIQVAIDSLGD